MSNEERIEQIVRGTTPEARRCLLNLLVDVEKVGTNFEAVCQTPDICREVLAVSHLVTLRHAIAFSLVREALPTNQALAVRIPTPTE